MGNYNGSKILYLGNSTHVLLSDMLLAVALPKSSRDDAFGDGLGAIKSTAEKVKHSGEKVVEQVGTRTNHI